MKYYRVKPEFDNRRYSVNGDFFIANELYTEKEVEKISKKYNILYAKVYNFNSIFEVVEISKRKIYWFFGARFAVTE